MKHLFTKWLSALLIASLLLSPVAMMEEGIGEVIVATEAGSDEALPAAEPEAANADEGEPAPVDEGEPAPADEGEPAIADADDAADDDFDDEIIPTAVDEAVGEAESVDLDAPVDAGLSVEGEVVAAEVPEDESAPLFEVLFGEGDATLTSGDIPDANFWNYLVANYDTDKDGVLSPEEVNSVNNINVAGEWTQMSEYEWGYPGMGITSLNGIGYFPNLMYLNCGGNAVTNLAEAISKNANLTSLSCEKCGLTTLDLSQNPGLLSVICSNNQLTELNVSACTALTDLSCNNNKLKTLNVSNCTKLRSLYATSNSIAELDVSSCPDLVSVVDEAYREKDNTWQVSFRKPGDEHGPGIYLSVDTKVTLTAGTTVIEATDIPIDEAHFPDPAFRNYIANNCDQPSGPSGERDGFLSTNELQRNNLSLTTYDPNTNQSTTVAVSSLKGIELFTNLETLNCSNSGLTELDVSKNTKLRILQCQGNNIPTLDITNCPKLVSIVDDDHRSSGRDQYGRKFVQYRLNSQNYSDVIELSHDSGTILKIGDKTIGPRSIAIDATNFPDDGFRAVVSQYDGRDGSAPDGVLSEDEISQIEDGMGFQIYDGASVKSLKGIALFKGLRSLTLYNANLDDGLDLSGNPQLSSLNLYSVTGLTKLDLSKNTQLYNASATMCGLTGIDVSNCSNLNTLKCNGNALTTLDISHCSATLTGAVTSANYVLRDGYTAVYQADSPYGSWKQEYLVCDANVRIIGGNPVDPIALPDPVDISEANFPDANFRQYITDRFDTIPKDGRLTAIEMGNARYIYLKKETKVDGKYTETPYGVKDLTGIALFTNLESIDCSQNPVTTLDLSGNPTLYSVDCWDCALTELDVSACIELTYLNCSGNKLTKLDLSKNKDLVKLYCSRNALTTLDISGHANLKVAEVSYNKLATLTAGNNPSLKVLNCRENVLETLDVANDSALVNLLCDTNKLTTIDVSTCTALKGNLTNARNKKADGVVTVEAYEVGQQDDSDTTSTYLTCDYGVQIVGATVDTSDDHQGPTVYKITTTVANNGVKGTLTASAAEAVKGDIITLTVEPESGSKLVTLTVNGPKGEIEVSDDNTFAMPGGDVTVLALFKKVPTVTAPTAKKNLTYNGQNQALIEAGATTGGVLEYSTDNENWSTAIPTAVDAGETSVWYRVSADDANVAVEAAGPVKATIAKKRVVVTVATETITYGDDIPTTELTIDKIEGLVGADTIDCKAVRPTDAKDVGSYPFQFADGMTLSNEKNYKPVIEGKLVILPREIELDWSNTELVYTGYEQKPTATVTGLAEGDSINVTVTGAEIDVGEYTATASAVANANYKLPEDATKLQHKFTIEKAEHENVVAPQEFFVDAAGVTDATLDLSTELEGAQAWSVKSCDGTFITKAAFGDGAEGVYTTLLTYTAAAAGEGVKGGNVVISVEESKNYKPYEVTVNFVTSEEFTLRFDTVGGTPEADRKLHKGQAYGTLPERARDGYEFLGWYADTDYKVKVDEKTEMGGADTTIYAKWSPVVYAVALDLNKADNPKATLPNGYESPSDDPLAGTADIPEIPFDVETADFQLPILEDQKDGTVTYAFAGWLLAEPVETAEEGEDAVDEAPLPQMNVTIVPKDPAFRNEKTRKITYVAQWSKGEKVGKISMDTDQFAGTGLLGLAGMDKTKTEVDTEDNKASSDAKKLAEDMKTIACNKSDAQEAEKTVTMEMSISTVDGDETSVAEIEAKVKEKHTDESGEEDKTVKTTFMEIKITKTVSEEKPAGGENPGQPPETVITEETEINDTKRVVEIPLQFNMNGRYSPSVFRYHGDEVTELKRLATRPKDYQNLDGCFYISGIGSNTVVYVYTRFFSTYAMSTSAKPTFTVYFEANNGNDPVAVTVEEGKKVAKPENPVKANTDAASFSFDKWFTDEECTRPYNFDEAVSADKTLYAGYFESAVVPVVVADVTGVYTGEAYKIAAVVNNGSAGNEDFEVYFSTTKALDETNYTDTTIASKEAPSRTDAGTTEVFWYVHSPSGQYTPSTKSGTAKIEIAPAAPTLVSAPTAKTLTFTGTAQELVNAGSAKNGTMQYKLEGGEFSNAIPTGSESKTYTVYYRVYGDKNYSVLEDASYKLTVTIAPAVTPEPPEPEKPITIAVLKKSVKSKQIVKPGTEIQIDLAGKTGKKFKSSKKKVATVNSSGLITVKSAGKTKITFKVGKKTRTLTLTIKDPTVPTKVTLSASGTVTGKKGEKLELTATLPEGTNSTIKWTSSNKKVATVDQSGVVTFKKPGNATITATAVRGKKKAKVKVKVTK